MDQATALKILKSGANVFLTGEAGSGKSYLLKQFMEFLKDNKVNFAATASTGIAASHFGGFTIHAWAGIGIKEYFTEENYLALRKRPNTIDRIQRCKVLFLDEISMLHRKQLELTDQVMRVIRACDKPFGGVQLVICGDFYQLPPVGKKDEKFKDKFAFMSQSWVEADLQVCYLNKQYRQSSGPLSDILNNIRANTVTEEDFNTLKKRATVFNQHEVLKLFTHNVNVDRINLSKLYALEGKIQTFTAESKGPEALVKNLKDSVRCPEILELKLNAKVMFVKNNDEDGYMNGTQGIITGFEKSDDTDNIIPIVTTTDGRLIPAELQTWEIIENEAVVASYKQIPLRLAWAITIHKSQGMTLSEAEVDLNKTFEDGMGYVALSRLQSIEGLSLIGINPNALNLNTLARKADIRFKELSAEHEQKWNLSETDIKKYHDNAMQWYKKRK